MISVRNTTRLKKYRIISHTGSIGGLFLILAGVLIPLFVESLAKLAGTIMIAGMFVALIGIYFANRWAKKPRPEDVIDQEFKGFTDKYRTYHYPYLPYDHILLAPSGATLIKTVNIEGAFTYKEGKWKEKMSMGRAMRYIVEEHLGDPIRDARDDTANLAGHLLEVTGEKIPVNCLVVFIHPRAVLDVNQASIPVITPKKLRPSINAKAAPISTESYEKIKEYLDQKTQG